MEKPVSKEQQRALTADFNRVILSYGVPLGEIYQIRNGKVTTRKRIQEFELDKWFFLEEHFRPKNDGFVFFVHTKFLLIDPLSDDPLVCSGSANFSSNSLLQNDENMLLIRGNTRVADIYMTEFDRIFRHFYFRDIANQLAGSERSDHAVSTFLDETDRWSESYFKPGTLKFNRRLMFFEKPVGTWFRNAIAKPDEKTVARPVRKKPSVKKTRVRGTAKKRKKPSVKKTRDRGTAKKRTKPSIRKTRVRGTAKKRTKR
jgi:phosphatidylserine/phosphatidylglycerophosphate/cardiolipin synthase-like enzyme